MLDRPPSFPFCEVGAEKGEDVRKGTAVRSMNGSSCWCWCSCCCVGCGCGRNVD